MGCPNEVFPPADPEAAARIVSWRSWWWWWKLNASLMILTLGKRNQKPGTTGSEKREREREREREKRILFRIDPFMMADCKLDTLGVSIIFFISNSTGW